MREERYDAFRLTMSQTIVSTHGLSSYRNQNNFRDPYEFIPERWISDEYASDKKHALNPFSLGPRNCLGKK